MKEQIKKIIFELVYGLYRRNILRSRLQVVSVEATIAELVSTNKSLVRYGDAEMRMIEGNSVEFQEYDAVLAEKMYEILQFKNENVMVAIPDIFESLDCYTDKSRSFWKEHLFFYRKMYEKYCSADKIYYNAFVSRCYYMFRDKEQSGKWFLELKKIWEGKALVIVEGEASHNGVDNDLFDHAAEIERIICPSKNAYRVYDKILESCLNYPVDRLFLTAVGNTAKVLTAELSARGYRAIDIGNLDMEYDWFLMGTDKKEHPKKHDYRTVEENIQAGYQKYVDQISHIIN